MMMEEKLIEYVRSNPLLHDSSHPEYRNHNSRRAAWYNFGEKYGMSGNKCKEIWNKLRNAHIQAVKRRSCLAGKNLPKWKFEEEMAFLTPAIESRKRNNMEKADDDGNEDDSVLTPDEETDTQAFTMMEEELIEHVRSNILLYDPSHREYRNQNARKEAWDQIGEKLGVSGNECKDNWNKLRNAYCQGQKRRSAQTTKNLGKWRFEDQMAFLPLTLESRKTQRNVELANCEIKNEPCPTLSEVADSQQMPNSQLKMGPLLLVCSRLNESANNIQLPVNTIPAVVPSMINESTASPATSQHFTKPDKRTSDRRKCLGNSPATLPKDLHDECDLFFLSMAKSVKKLCPENQFKVKMAVSEIVFQAELHTAQNNPLSAENNTELYQNNTFSTFEYSPKTSHQSAQSCDDSSSSQSPYASPTDPQMNDDDVTEILSTL